MFGTGLHKLIQNGSKKQATTLVDSTRATTSSPKHIGVQSNKGRGPVSGGPRCDICAHAYLLVPGSTDNEIFNGQNFALFCGTIGSKRRSIKAHIMCLVQCILLYQTDMIEILLLPYNLYYSLREIW